MSGQQQKKKLPPGIDEHRKGEYRARMYYQGKRHTIGTYRTIGDARAALEIARGEKARGIFVPPDQERAQRQAAKEAQERLKAQQAATVRQLADAWLAWLERLQRREGTIYTYRRRLESHFLPTFGERPAVTITADEVTHWYDQLTASHGKGVADQIYLAVAAMFRYGTGHSKGLPRTFQPWLETSPADVPGAGQSTKAKSAAGEVVATPEEIAAIAQGMPAREAMAVMLAGWCALRIGEVLGLRRRHILTSKTKPASAWLTVEEQVQARGSGIRLEPPKSAAGRRTIPVPTPIVPMLTQHLAEHVQPSPEAFLFPRTPQGTQPHHPNTFRGHFNSARDTVATQSNKKNPPLARMTFHGLRHSCLTRLGQAGATLSDLMTFAGHSDVESVMIYQHSERDRLASLAESMGEKIRLPNQPSEQANR